MEIQPHASHRNGLGNLIFRDTIFAAFTAKATVLDTTESGTRRSLASIASGHSLDEGTKGKILNSRRSGITDDPRVDSHHPHLQRFRNPIHPPQILGIKVPSQPHLHLVRHLHHILLTLKLIQPSHRAKRLLARHLHIHLHARNDGRLEEVGAQVLHLVPALHDLAALARRILDVCGDFADGAVMDQGTMRDAFREPAADFEALDLLCEERGEFLVDALLHVDPVRAYTRLARAPELAGDGTRNGRLEIGIVKDDEGRIAPKLEGDLFERIGRLLHEQLAHARRARERDFAHRRARRQRLAHLGRVRQRGDDVDDALGYAGSMRQLR